MDRSREAGGRSQVRPRLLLPSPGLAWARPSSLTSPDRRKQVEPGAYFRPGAVKSSKKGRGASPSPPLQLGAARTPCPRPAARPGRSGPGPPPCRVTQAPRAGRSGGPAAQVGRGGRGASVTPAGGRGGAAAAPRPGKKPARCGFGARRQRGGDSRPRRPTPPPARDPAPLRPRRAASRSSRSRSVPGARPPPACRARSGRAGPSGEARPRDPSASPAQPRRGASPWSP
ncbi:unnamed protein product [Rangifer tarandus platyrhynchus]|uniref:Uncharacterized protein n=2 Tax=Rangifer tarandus platyrhynchus TaxID=3082113 RepID=A0ACB0ETQ2_RANTA|nr:unnamed protein product [Rangifer tarandus platyrhynchus]CAI9704065.1 unnamed protein product [Rangifer tarandus platyrhynchus]